MTLTVVPTQSVPPAVDAWTAPADHKPSYGPWTPFLRQKWTELSAWCDRNDVTVTLGVWANGWFGAYNDLTPEIRLHETLSPRQLVSTFAHECIHAARRAYGFGWQHQEDQADEGAVALLVDPVRFAQAEERHQDLTDVDSYGVSIRDRLVGRDLEVSVLLLPAARRMWASTVFECLDHLSASTNSELDHSRWLHERGVER
ncbi:ImmA/IrrE family metallo-endopeptidase [Nakamurella sp. A5-74]|uniref:ImmA/IrrE family metallo-endopeptidase n=1 Tax=Nakamurella sp. A5-74 TaxID=3158264 RepID=A0AAU8DN74_9ACTN